MRQKWKLQMKQAMRMCFTGPETLRFETTIMDVSLAKDVAKVINEHPTSFESLSLWNESKLNNNGLKAIVENLNASALQNVERLHLHCGLSGQEGGQLIH
eukprot:Platyproteum_vivax@DN16931_c0_g1_i1.p1